jgi:large subunit ribosomal protein L10
MQRSEKEHVVAELTERLRVSQALIVADYRGLTNSQLEGLRTELDKHGARLSVVKNTLTRLAAEAAGADTVLALLEGPTAIAFIESEGDPVAVAKALGQTARETRVLAVRGGVLEGKSLTSEDVENLAKLPPFDVLRGQVLGAITAPLYAIVGLFTAPLQDLHGLIDARIAQLEESSPGADAEATAPEADEASAAEAAPAAEVATADADGAAEGDAQEAAADPASEASTPEAPAAEAEAAPAAEEAPAGQAPPDAETAPAADESPAAEAAAESEPTESVETAVEAEGSSDE